MQNSSLANFKALLRVELLKRIYCVTILNWLYPPTFLSLFWIWIRLFWFWEILFILWFCWLFINSWLLIPWDLLSISRDPSPISGFLLSISWETVCPKFPDWLFIIWGLSYILWKVFWFKLILGLRLRSIRWFLLSIFWTIFWFVSKDLSSCWTVLVLMIWLIFDGLLSINWLLS